MSGRVVSEYEAVISCCVIAPASYVDWIGRLDGFCNELKSKGFELERDGLTVKIKAPPPGGSDAAGQAAS